MNILIVDSDKAMANQIARKMEKCGHRTEKYSAGNQALARIKEKLFDLVLLELFLPDINGNELISRIKSRWPETRIITMTGHNSRELELKIRRQGVHYYMIKPYEIKYLKTIIDHIYLKELSNQN